MEPMSASDYCRDTEEIAHEAFTTHQLALNQTDRWIVKKQDSGMHRAEIVTLRGGGLVVWGDIELVCFAYGPKERDRGLVFWIAGGNLAYAREKAAIGSSYPMTEFVPAVAIYELIEMRRDYEDQPKVFQEIEYALDDLRHGRTNNEELLAELHGVGVDAETLGSLGRVPAMRVFYAHAAVKRLAKLLEEERP